MRRPDPDRIRQAKDAGLEARLHGRPLPVTRPLAPNTTPELRRAMVDGVDAGHTADNQPFFGWGC